MFFQASFQTTTEPKLPNSARSAFDKSFEINTSVGNDSSGTTTGTTTELATLATEDAIWLITLGRGLMVRILGLEIKRSHLSHVPP